MQLSKKTREIITNLLIAAGISIIVNIADIMFLIRTSTEQSTRLAESENIVMDTVTVQGRTYIIPASKYQRTHKDTVRIKKPQNLDSLITAHSIPDSLLDAKFSISNFENLDSTLKTKILYILEQRRNMNIPIGPQRPNPGPGQEMKQGPTPGPNHAQTQDRKVYFRRPTMITYAVMRSGHYQTRQLLFYFILGFLLISMAAYQSREKKRWGFPLRLGGCLLITVMAYFLAPNVASNGEIISTMRFPSREMYDTTLLLKCSLVFIVAALYGKIYELITQRQNIILENEKLKSENLQATYSTLINQMNPHFFFNSLNSLSMLVRENHNKQALTYIDRLSDTFRYILQNGATGEITLEEELKFTEAYKYLLEIRYEGKLFVTFNVDEKYMNWVLPSLTLQPLLENAVKHNTITKAEPLQVEIVTDGSNNIRISNSFNPKIDKGEGTGIGLRNLSERYRLLTGKDITIIHNEKEFTVILPLIPPTE